jgi:predicted nucleic acid-binding Zn ribbon protein
MTVKNCLACDRPIKGRTDKKFCDDSCRNNFNNRLNSDATPLIRTINNILRRNRRILFELLGESDKPVLVDKARLIAKGFHFEFFTEQFTNDKAEVYYYCYDYGYRVLEAEKYMAVKNKKREYTGRRRKLPAP